jgi:hypothetical protein
MRYENGGWEIHGATNQAYLTRAAIHSGTDGWADGYAVAYNGSLAGRLTGGQLRFEPRAMYFDYPRDVAPVSADEAWSIGETGQLLHYVPPPPPERPFRVFLPQAAQGAPIR